MVFSVKSVFRSVFPVLIFMAPVTLNSQVSFGKPEKIIASPRIGIKTALDKLWNFKMNVGT